MTRRGMTRRGFSLAETAVASVILAVLVVAGLRAAGALGVSRRAMTEREFADEVARATLAEIAALPYRDPTMASSAIGLESDDTRSRATFDDVDDYDGLLESPPADREGTTLVSEAGWELGVSVMFVDWSGRELKDTGSETGLKLVRVVVKRGGRELATREMLRSEAHDAARP